MNSFEEPRPWPAAQSGVHPAFTAIVLRSTQKLVAHLLRITGPITITNDDLVAADPKRVHFVYGEDGVSADVRYLGDEELEAEANRLAEQFIAQFEAEHLAEVEDTSDPTVET